MPRSVRDYSVEKLRVGWHIWVANLGDVSEKRARVFIGNLLFSLTKVALEIVCPLEVWDLYMEAAVAAPINLQILHRLVVVQSDIEHGRVQMQ